MRINSGAMTSLSDDDVIDGITVSRGLPRRLLFTPFFLESIMEIMWRGKVGKDGKIVRSEYTTQ